MDELAKLTLRSLGNGTARAGKRGFRPASCCFC
jgi:hypothetical protein